MENKTEFVTFNNSGTIWLNPNEHIVVTDKSTGQHYSIEVRNGVLFAEPMTNPDGSVLTNDNNHAKIEFYKNQKEEQEQRATREKSKIGKDKDGRDTLTTTL